MKFLYSLLFINLALLFSANAQDYTEQKEITKQVIGNLESENFSEIYTLFDDKMKAAISVDKLREIWKTLPLQCGKYIKNGKAIASEVHGFIVVNHFLDFENVDLDLRLAFDAENQISGLFFVPPVKKKD
jgi:hypothetical protein